MAQDLTQWLAEIRVLKQKLADVQKERDEAYISSSRWRSLYEKEVRHHRSESIRVQQTIEQLNAQGSLMSKMGQEPNDVSDNSVHAFGAAENYQTANELDVSTLEAKLIHALAECDRLSKALQLEQANHEKTRMSLTNALGDTIERLTRERSGRASIPERTLTTRPSCVSSEKDSAAS